MLNYTTGRHYEKFEKKVGHLFNLEVLIAESTNKAALEKLIQLFNSDTVSDLCTFRLPISVLLLCTLFIAQTLINLITPILMINPKAIIIKGSSGGRIHRMCEQAFEEYLLPCHT